MLIFLLSSNQIKKAMSLPLMAFRVPFLRDYSSLLKTASG